jgi:hypothetical protein
MCSSKKSATFCDHAQATDRFSILRVPPMALLAIAAICMPLLERQIVAVMVRPNKRQPFRHFYHLSSIRIRIYPLPTNISPRSKAPGVRRFTGCLDKVIKT